MTIEKVDAHHHLWSLGSAHYPLLTAPPIERFLGNTGRLRHEFGIDEFLRLARAQNVTGSVYVESHFEPAIEETAFVQAIADAHGFPHAIVGRVDLTSEDLGAALDVHMQSPLFCGIRIMVGADPDPKYNAAAEGIMTTSAWRAGYREVGQRGLIAEVMAYPNQLANLADIAAEAPETPLVVGHAGMPLRRSAREHDIWVDGLSRLAAQPQVSVKISGLGMTDHGWTEDTIRPIVTHIIAQFTPARCMFASNFPVDGIHASYDRVWEAFDNITRGLPDADRTLLFRDTARRLYKIA